MYAYSNLEHLEKKRVISYINTLVIHNIVGKSSEEKYERDEKRIEM